MDSRTATPATLKYRSSPLASMAAVGLGVGVVLASGFFAVTQPLAAWVLDWLQTLALPANAVRWLQHPQSIAWAEVLSFTFVAWVFYLSVPPRRALEARPDRAGIWFGMAPAFATALVFGGLHPAQGLFAYWGAPGAGLALAWTLLLAPLGEELLFRGWLYNIAHRVWPGSATQTNPLPCAVWVSAVAFSLWHLQNAGSEPPGFVLFQMAYTLPVGLWLGWMRSKSQRLWEPVVAHSLLNLGALLM